MQSSNKALNANTVCMALLAVAKLIHVSAIDQWADSEGWRCLLAQLEAVVASLTATQYLKALWVFAKLPYRPQGALMALMRQHSTKAVPELVDYKSIAKFEYAMRTMHMMSSATMHALTQQAGTLAYWTGAGSAAVH